MEKSEHRSEDPNTRKPLPDALFEAIPISRADLIGKCDFCNTQPVVEKLLIPDFIMSAELGLNSVDGWSVCEACKELVDAQDANSLLERSFNSLPNMSYGLPDLRRRQYIAELHLKFWRAIREQVDRKKQNVNRQIAELVALRSKPWLLAIDAQFEAHRTLSRALALANKDFPNQAAAETAASIRNSWETDRIGLEIAETYSFSGDALAAISLASETIPTDVHLAPEQVPGSGQGFWWFTPPLFPNFATNYSSTGVCGLLWGYMNPKLEPFEPKQFPPGTAITEVFNEFDAKRLAADSFITFSIYTRTSEGVLSPSTQWRWFPNETLDAVVERTALEYRTAYAPNSSLVKNAARTGVGLFGEEHTLAIVRRVSQFFLAAAVWIESEYLEIPKTGKLERHARKRFAREAKLQAPPDDVRVVALRRRAAPESAGAANEASEGKLYQLSCRFLVRGHLRKQPYGPNRSLVKLIHIAPFLKGPESSPFRASKRVFAVIR